jgi:hypothetical protein
MFAELSTAHNEAVYTLVDELLQQQAMPVRVIARGLYSTHCHNNLGQILII